MTRVRGKELLVDTDGASLCIGCGLPLPLRPTRKGETGQPWQCKACGAGYVAVLRTDVDKRLVGNAIARSAKRTSGPIVARPSGVARQALPPRTKPPRVEPSSLTRHLEHAIATKSELFVRPSEKPFLKTVKQHGTTPYDEQLHTEMVEGFDDALTQVESLIDSLERGKQIDPGAHEAVVRETLANAAQDLDLFLNLGVNPSSDDYPGRHSLHVAMLAIAMGSQLGWDHQTLLELGTGCLLHDIGMVLVPDQVFRHEGVLSEAEFARVAKHPIRTFDLIEGHFDSIPLLSRVVAYQMHERCNGQGYPCKRPAAQIHQAAKVAAVADVYIALVSPRPHRPALMPYYAVEHLLQQVKHGEFEPQAVRALLNCVSLFPIGSFVELSDGRVARVLRNHPTDYSRPVVEVWRDGQVDHAGDVLALADAPGVIVAKPLPEPRAA